MHDLLLMLFLTPFMASLFIFALGFLPSSRLKPIALVLAMAPLFILLWNHSKLIGMNIDNDWLPALGIRFQLSIDSLSLIFLYLTSIVVPISMYGTRSSEITHPNIFFGLILFLEGLLIGFFTAQDLALFTIFWEAMLLPLYFIIAIFGGAKRKDAAIKFLVYMIAGSALLVVAVLALYFVSVAHGSSTFNIESLAKIASSSKNALPIFAIFILAFAVKTPLFPFHAWLSDTYYEAPVTGTILLSGILSKAGIYGILRVGMGLFPALMKEWSPFLLGFAVAGVFYGAFAAWRQFDYKRLIAYSSLSHVNFILVGLFVFNEMSLIGGIFQVINHAITISALFLVTGWLQHRIGTTAIGDVSGVAKHMPKLCWLTLFFVLASVALPGTNNFIGELFIFYGAFEFNPILTGFLGLSIIFSVVYMLRFMQKVYFGIDSKKESNWNDIRNVNFLIAAPLVLLILWIGIYPTPLLNVIIPSVEMIDTKANVEHSS